MKDKRIINEIFVNGNPVDITETGGKLGKLGGKDTVVILTRVIPDLSPNKPGRFIGVATNAKHNATEKKDHSKVEGTIIYQTTVPIKDEIVVDDTTKPFKTKKVTPFVTYPTNHHKVVEVFKNGHMRIWEIGIVSENGEFFLTTQLVWDVWLFRNTDGKVFLPALSNWETLMVILNIHVDPKGLRPITEYNQSDDEVSAEGLSAEEGRVQFYNSAQGFGIAVTTKGPAKIHWSQIPGGHTADLSKGDIIRFKNLISPSGHGDKVPAVRLQAKGITISEVATAGK